MNNNNNPGTGWSDDGGTPHVEPSVEFDYNAIDAALGFEDRGNPLAGFDPDAIEVAGELLHDVLAWLARDDEHSHGDLRTIGAKTIVMVFALRPDLLPGDRLLAGVARRFNVKKQTLKYHLDVFRKKTCKGNLRISTGWKDESKESLKRKRKTAGTAV